MDNQQEAQPDTYESVESIKTTCTSAPCTQQLHFLSCANELDRSATTQKQLFERGLCAGGGAVRSETES